MSVSKRQLGKNGPLVSAVGFGCMGMSHGYGNDSNEEENLKVLNRAIDLGCTFWDTADVYGAGENEKLVAKVLAKRRDEVFLCTKFSLFLDPETKKMSVRGDKEYVKKCCDASLERLGINTIDLYYQHRVDPNTPIEETVSAMTELVKEGKVEYLGLSECSAATLRRAYAIHPISALQVEYSPWETSIEKNGLFEACHELGIAIVAFSPLGKGFLTGKLDVDSLSEDDFRKKVPRFYSDDVVHNQKLVDKIQEIAAAKKIAASQLSLAWVLSQGDFVIPIPGTRRLKYLEENFEAAKVSLSKDEELQVREMVNKIEVKVDRYNPEMMKMVNI